MSDMNNAVKSAAKVVGGCLPGQQMPMGSLPNLPVPPTVILPVVVAGVAAHAVRSLVGRLFN